MDRSPHIVDLIDRIQKRLNAVGFFVNDENGIGLPPTRADVISEARGYPLPIVAMGIAAYQATGDAAERAHPQIMTAIGLYWWGYHREAQIWLDDAQDASEADAIYRDWYVFLCERVQRRKKAVNDELLVAADALESMGDVVGAWQCRQDAVLEWTVYDTDRAVEVLVEANRFLEQHDRTVDVCLGKLRLIYVYMMRSEFDNIPSLFAEIDSALDADHMRGLDCFVKLYRGRYASQIGQFEEASRHTQAAQAEAESIQHRYYQAIALVDTAQRCAGRGEIELARQADTKVLDLATVLEWAYGIATATLQLGNYQLLQGDYSGARELYLEAREKFDYLHEDLYSATCTMNLGIVAHSQNMFAEALDLLETARCAFEAFKSFRYLALANHNLGKIYAYYGLVNEAIPYFEKSIAVLQEGGMTWRTVRSQIFLARIMMDRPDEPDHLRAENLLKLSRSQAEVKGLEQDMALVAMAEADLAYRRAQYAQALEGYGQAAEHLEGLRHHELASEARLGMAASHLRRMEIGEVRAILAGLDFDSLPAVFKWRYHFLQARLHLLTGDILSAKGEYLSAIQHLRQARIGLANDDDRAHFVFRMHRSFDEAFAFAVRVGDAEMALQIVESISAADTYEADQTGAQGSEGFDSLLVGLRQNLADRYGQGWCILRFYRHGAQFFVFKITPQETTLALIPGLKFDDPAVVMCANPDDSFRRRVYDDLESSGIVSGMAMRRRLYDAFLRAVLPDDLDPDATLMIIPSRELHGLPFHALLDGDEPLIMKTGLASAYSLSALASMVDRPINETAIVEGQGVILAQSTFSDERFADLAHVQTEVAAIETQVVGRVRCVSPDELDEATLQAIIEGQESEGCTWLHIATHSDYDRRDSLSSGLVLGEDSISIEAIRRWETAVRLVTMSACQTASWRWMHGEIIVSLTSAFLDAGAETVIASQWDVYDRTTARLMARLYERLAAGDRPAAALAVVQREMHRSGISPYYWATFGVYGVP